MTAPTIWEPTLMATTTTAAFTRSGEVPSSLELRPFGLSMTNTVDEAELPELPQITYDPQRQLSIDSTGTPAATGSDGALRAGTSQDTRYDNQWFVDAD